MSLLDKASLVLTPNAVKASKLYSVVPANGTGDLTVVRNTTATRVNSSGLIENVATNVPRLNYDSVGGVPSLLLELQKTNLLLNSATLVTQSITTTAAAHNLSFRGTGTVTLSGSFSGSLVGSGSNNKVALTFTPTAGTLTVTISGSCTNGQIELGNTTSFILTTSSAVTRNTDLISKTGISDLIGQTEGTIFIDAKVGTGASTNLISLHKDLTNDNRIFINFKPDSNSFDFFLIKNNVVQVTFSFSGGNISQNFQKIAFVYKPNNSAFFVNGVKVGSDLICETYAENTLSILSFNNASGSSPFQGNVRGLQLYKTALTDAECVSLTTL